MGTSVAFLLTVVMARVPLIGILYVVFVRYLREHYDLAATRKGFSFNRGIIIFFNKHEGKTGHDG